jgi:peptidoglycan/xylan/chitin deacetylase (PgdA/CDA1 family)
MTGVIQALRQRLSPYSPRPRVHQWVFRRQIPMTLPGAIASFTFDDFPRSAYLNGGRILERFGARGTYYASLGLMDTEDYYGPLFTKEDLTALIGKGHELGCHTYSHVGARQTSRGGFQEEIRKNRRRAEELLPGYALRNFAYPGGQVTLRVKRQMRKYAASSRGTYVGVNRHRLDLDLLLIQNLFENNSLDRVKEVVDGCKDQPGWLVFYGHGVCERATRYGCTPGYLEAVLEIVATTCRIMTVTQGLEFIGKSRIDRPAVNWPA